MISKSTLIKKVRQENGKNIDLYASPDELREIYADGAAVMFGIPNSKIQFHSTSSVEEEKDGLIEKREIKARIVIPTNTLLDLLLNVLTGMKENEKDFSVNIDEFKNQIIDNINKINFTDESKTED